MYEYHGMMLPTDKEKRELLERLNKRIVYLALKLNNTVEDFETFAHELFDEYYKILGEYPSYWCTPWLTKALYSNTLKIRNIALDKFNRGEDITARIESFMDYDTSEIVV